MNSILSSALSAFHEEALEILRQIEDEIITSFQALLRGEEQWQPTRRLLHSLKGSAASFGNESIAQICHAIEQVLADKHQLPRHEADVLLTAIDNCRQLIDHPQLPSTFLAENLTKCLDRLNSLDQSKHHLTELPVPQELHGSVWQIDFAPHPQFFENGHDPLRIFRALRHIGSIKISVFTDKLPDFADFDPFYCYLRWQIILKAEINYHHLLSQFEWVNHVCDLNIEMLAGSQTKPRSDSTSYKINEANLQALLNVSHSLQTHLQQTIAQTDTLNQSDKVRLSRRHQAMKRQHQLLQQQLLNITMRPLADAFSRLPRMAFDLAHKTNKQIQVHMHIDPIELDSLIISSLIDPLSHLLRNALAHGIESDDIRHQLGKPVKGQIHITAQQVDEKLLIRFSDDGGGLSEEKILNKAKQLGGNNDGTEIQKHQLSEWIFRAGFSTSLTADAISGRGVGLDVVKQHVVDMGGKIELVSNQGKGCCFTLSIPVHHTLMDVQIIQVAKQILALPLINVLDTYAEDSSRVIWNRGKQWFITNDNQQIPLIDVRQFLQLSPRETDDHSGFIVLLRTENSLFALLVDGLAEQIHLLSKSLRPHYRYVKGVKGIAILPEGGLALLLEPSQLFLSFARSGNH